MKSYMRNHYLDFDLCLGMIYGYMNFASNSPLNFLESVRDTGLVPKGSRV